MVDFENDTITIDNIITQSNGKLIISYKTKTKSSKRLFTTRASCKIYLA